MQVTTMQDTTVSLWERQQVDHVFVLLLVEVVVLTVLTVMDTLVVMDVVCLVIDVNTNQTTLTLVQQVTQDLHKDHSIVEIEDYNLHRLRQWHNQDQEQDQTVVVHVEVINLDHGQVEVEYTDLLMEVDVVVDHQVPKVLFMWYTTRI